MKRVRVTVGTRLALILCGLAAFTTGLALVLQDLALSGDLREAARGRLQRTASVAGRLLEGHLAALQDRYRAISQTPEFRANLDAGHPPTLRYYAERLALQQDAPLLLFADRHERVIASAGTLRLADAALERLRPGAPDPCESPPPGADPRRCPLP